MPSGSTAGLSGGLAAQQESEIKEIEGKGEHKMSVKINTFEHKGKTYPTIELKETNSRFGFTFGLSKARLIIENYDDIRQFVQDNEEASK
jgi:hypothetical protein